jgi:hypothetical protein
MKKILLSILAVLSVGAVASVRANDSASLTPAERNAALFASGAAIRICPVYYHDGYRYYHRRLVGYRTVRVTTYVDGVRYVRYKQRPVYTYW